jgi:hypothetical protein
MITLHIENKIKFQKYKIWEDYSAQILIQDFKLNLKQIPVLLKDRKECVPIHLIELIHLDLL